MRETISKVREMVEIFELEDGGKTFDAELNSGLNGFFQVLTRKYFTCTGGGRDVRVRNWGKNHSTQN